MKHLLIIGLISIAGAIAQAGPTCAEYFHYKTKGIDWPYALPMSDFADQCKRLLVPKHCSYMSKDPSCWEGKDSAKRPRPNICLPKSLCETIESSYQDKFAQYHCKAVNGDQFSCDKIVEELGTHLEGVVVNVTVPYVDGCHVIGGCGGHACVPSYGAARLDQACQ